jgi:hypothetical protein
MPAHASPILVWLIGQCESTFGYFLGRIWNPRSMDCSVWIGLRLLTVGLKAHNFRRQTLRVLGKGAPFRRIPPSDAKRTIAGCGWPTVMLSTKQADGCNLKAWLPENTVF